MDKELSDFKRFHEGSGEAAAEAYTTGDARPIARISTRESPATFFSPKGAAHVQGAHEVVSGYEHDDARLRSGWQESPRDPADGRERRARVLGRVPARHGEDARQARSDPDDVAHHRSVPSRRRRLEARPSGCLRRHERVRGQEVVTLARVLARGARSRSQTTGSATASRRLFVATRQASQPIAGAPAAIARRPSP